MFLSVDGTRGIISGPHPEFTKVHRGSHFSDSNKRSYYSSDVQNYIGYLQAVTTLPPESDKIYKNFEISDLCDVSHCLPDVTSPNALSNELAFGAPIAGMGLRGRNGKVYDMVSA